MRGEDLSEDAAARRPYHEATRLVHQVIISFWRHAAMSGAALQLSLAMSGCDSRRGPARDIPASPPAPTPAAAPAPVPVPPRGTPAPGARGTGFEEQPGATERGSATWYEVPKNSLAKRRSPGEFTAAHDRLPIGSYARVTNLGNGRSVVVRITDRGIDKKGAIDLCKEAAEEIGLVAQGVATVQIDALRERPQSGTPNPK